MSGFFKPSSGAPTNSPTFTGNLLADSPTFFVDGTNNNVGIGTISPNAAQKLHVNADGFDGVYISNSGANSVKLTLENTQAVWELHLDTGGSLNISDGNAHTTTFSEAGVLSTGTDDTTVNFSLTTAHTEAGASTATLTNSPIAGDPSTWMQIEVNGQAVYIPCWS